MHQNKLPSISVVTATYNSEKTLNKCLSLVRTQNYPQEKIEIILGDGGSTDTTFSIAKKHKAKIVEIAPEKQNAEYNRGVAFNKAKNELVLILDHDNFMVGRNWLFKMVQPFLNHPKLVAAETLHYHYDRKNSLLDRYFALFGVNDPVAYYLKKADRMPYTQKKWSGSGNIKEFTNYFLVKFGQEPRLFPTIGTNGCMMRRKLVTKYADARPEHHYPIDVMLDVVKNGYNQFAFVKISLAHLTGARGVFSYIKRRKKFMEDYHLHALSKRRYSVFMPGDELNLIKFIFYSLTIIKPLWDALKGFYQIRDAAWFVHPVMCLGLTLVYSSSLLKNKLK